MSGAAAGRARAARCAAKKCAADAVALRGRSFFGGLGAIACEAIVGILRELVGRRDLRCELFKLLRRPAQSNTIFHPNTPRRRPQQQPSFFFAPPPDSTLTVPAESLPASCSLCAFFR